MRSLETSSRTSLLRVCNRQKLCQVHKLVLLILEGVPESHLKERFSSTVSRTTSVRNWNSFSKQCSHLGTTNGMPATSRCDMNMFPLRSSSRMSEKVRSEAHEWARNLDLSAASVRKACLSLSSKTAIRLDQHVFKDTPLLADNALGSLGEIIRQCFVKLATPSQSLFQLFVLLGWKNGGSRTIAILHTTYRLTMRLMSAHISQWDVNFAGKWDSALKGNSALRAHVARAMGIELAHSEGQFVIHFLWEKRKLYDSMKAHLSIPQLVARGYPLKILVLGTLTHKSPRCPQVCNCCSNIMGCASSILAGFLQSCSWTRGLLLEFVQALGYVVPGSVCEEHFDVLSHFVTNKSRVQVSQDAAGKRQ